MLSAASPVEPPPQHRRVAPHQHSNSRVGRRRKPARANAFKTKALAGPAQLSLYKKLFHVPQSLLEATFHTGARAHDSYLCGLWRSEEEHLGRAAVDDERDVKHENNAWCRERLDAFHLVAEIGVFGYRRNVTSYSKPR